MDLKVFKRLCVLCCALMLCGISADAQGFFTDSGDAVLEYVRTTAQDGKFKWRHTMRVTDVKETESSVRYTTSSVFSKQCGNEDCPLFHIFLSLNQNNENQL